MTREEQIRDEIGQRIGGNYGSYIEGYEEGFIHGAKWADENPKKGLVDIDKVCKYLDNVLYEVVSGISGLPDIMSIENTTMEDFIKNFRKAMEK